ncbi:MAG: globin-coupled sensor protein [Bradyrhizobium sp.]|uniref:globin-coupled sensor protein n=1 Tax=Bradyrhizobium sp. TaxID=376 RepID=UPI001DF3ACF5|nr:globin-coupled sensor protein [Bradyrhizobium sp.]MBV9565604.1 globin-coupled sensor protein [Bradyrhizobium sp.]
MKEEQSIRSRLDVMGMDRKARESLKELQPLIAAALPNVLDQLYAWIARQPQLAPMFPTEVAVRQAKEAQIEHWRAMVNGAFDEAYVTSVSGIAKAHHRLGLEQHWYIAGHSRILTGLLHAIETGMPDGWFKEKASREKRAALQAALTRAVLLDMDLAISVYLDTARDEQRTALQSMASTFEAAIGEIVGSVSSASTDLEASAGTLTKTAEATQLLSTSVAAASGQVSTSVQSVASATEEMSLAVNEIGRQVTESSNIAGEAVRQVEQTDAGISELSRTAERIGDVLKLITSIAGQTNLLALNATIEAARAGDAGRGFAVVASEVKALASQTAQATDDISQQIVGIQTATQAAVAAIKEIGATIRKISEISAGIAASAEQQGAATKAISRNFQEVASGSAKVAQNIGEVSQGANATGAASSQVLSSARSLSKESSRLRLELDKFLRTVRAA